MSQEYREELHVYYECSEHALIERFFLEVILAAPRVFVTYNGDYFDWPFVEKKQPELPSLELVLIYQIGMETNAERIGTPQTQG
jgi:DNA polymerase epsilon subunit 1